MQVWYLTTGSCGEPADASLQPQPMSPVQASQYSRVEPRNTVTRLQGYSRTSRIIVGDVPRQHARCADLTTISQSIMRYAAVRSTHDVHHFDVHFASAIL